MYSLLSTCCATTHPDRHVLCVLPRADIPLSNVRFQREAAAAAAAARAAPANRGGLPLDPDDDPDAGLNHMLPAPAAGRAATAGEAEGSGRSVQASSPSRHPSELLSTFSSDLYRMTLVRKSVPGFFIAVGGDDVAVRAQPGLEGATDVVRMIDKVSNCALSILPPVMMSLTNMPQGTVVFVTEFVSIPRTDMSPTILSSIVWLRIPDGWVPMESVQAGRHATITLPLFRPFSPNDPPPAASSGIATALSAAAAAPGDMSNLFAVSAGGRDRHGAGGGGSASSRTPHSSRSAPSTDRPEDKEAFDDTMSPPSHKSGYPPRSSRPSPSKCAGSGSPSSGSNSHDVSPRRAATSSSSSDTHASNAAVSDAIMKAREEISVLTRQLREASSDHSKGAARQAGRALRLPSNQCMTERRFGSGVRQGGGNDSAGRIAKLIAMQQHIDLLSNSITDIRDALAEVRAGLVDALTGRQLSVLLAW